MPMLAAPIGLMGTAAGAAGASGLATGLGLAASAAGTAGSLMGHGSGPSAPAINGTGQGGVNLAPPAPVQHAPMQSPIQVPNINQYLQGMQGQG